MMLCVNSIMFQRKSVLNSKTVQLFMNTNNYVYQNVSLYWNMGWFSFQVLCLLPPNNLVSWSVFLLRFFFYSYFSFPKVLFESSVSFSFLRILIFSKFFLFWVVPFLESVRNWNWNWNYWEAGDCVFLKFVMIIGEEKKI